MYIFCLEVFKNLATDYYSSVNTNFSQLQYIDTAVLFRDKN